MASGIPFLPALISPLIEAAITAVKEGHIQTLQAHLIEALDKARLFEAVSKKNAECARQFFMERNRFRRERNSLEGLLHEREKEIAELTDRVTRQEKIIESLRADLAAMQREGGEI